MAIRYGIQLMASRRLAANGECSAKKQRHRDCQQQSPWLHDGYASLQRLFPQSGFTPVKALLKKKVAGATRSHHAALWMVDGSRDAVVSLLSTRSLPPACDWPSARFHHDSPWLAPTIRHPVFLGSEVPLFS
jgi:hypothetical protein